MGNLGVGPLIEYSEFCILLLNNHLRANNTIIFCYYFHVYIHRFILHLLLVRRQIPVSLKIDVESKQKLSKDFCQERRQQRHFKKK